MPPIYSKEWNRITIQVHGDHRQGRTSPCEHACPLGNGIQQMHTLIAAGETGKASPGCTPATPSPASPGACARIRAKPNATGPNTTSPSPSMRWNGLPPTPGMKPASFPCPPRASASPWSVPVLPVHRRPLRALLGHAVTVYESAPVMAGAAPCRARLPAAQGCGGPRNRGHSSPPACRSAPTSPWAATSPCKACSTPTTRPSSPSAQEGTPPTSPARNTSFPPWLAQALHARTPVPRRENRGHPRRRRGRL